LLNIDLDPILNLIINLSGISGVYRVGIYKYKIDVIITYIIVQILIITYEMWINCIKEENGEYSIMIYITNFLDKDELYDCKTWLNDKYETGSFRDAKNNFDSNEKDSIASCHVSSQSIRTNVRKQIWFQRDNGYFCNHWKERYHRWQSAGYDIYLDKLENMVSSRLQYYNKINLWEYNFQFNLSKLCESYREKKTHEYYEDYEDYEDYTSYNKLDNSFKFNSCLVNLYNNGSEGIAPHRDSIHSFGLYPTIVGLSIGETRIMRLQRIHFNEDNISSLKKDVCGDKRGLSIDIPLENNSLFIMMGCSQKYYTHEILKDDSIFNKRYSFTFRNWLG